MRNEEFASLKFSASFPSPPPFPLLFHGVEFACVSLAYIYTVAMNMQEEEISIMDIGSQSQPQCAFTYETKPIPCLFEP